MVARPWSSSRLSVKKAEHRRIDAFEVWCWRRLLKVPLDSKEIKPVNTKGDQSWIFIGRTNAKVEAPIFWPPDVKNWLTGKALMLEKTEGRRRGWQRMRRLDGITDLMDICFSKLQAPVMNREAWGAAVDGVAKRQTRLRDWTDTWEKILDRYTNNYSNSYN